MMLKSLIKLVKTLNWPDTTYAHLLQCHGDYSPAVSSPVRTPNDQYSLSYLQCTLSFSALTLLVCRQEGHPACKN